MFDSGSRVWEEREFSLRQSHEAVSQRMAAQQTDTHKVQAHYIIFYGTYATSMPAHPPRGESKASKPTAPRRRTALRMNKTARTDFPIAGSIFTAPAHIYTLYQSYMP